ncbi:MAG TPA: NAD(P)-binding domain-containing protein [Hyphomicrobium sp.]|nr:NAD(P)-binding domain-containing protein [Hyphomicrobium sp.]
MRRNAITADRLLVIGAGPIGLAMADALKQRGIAFDQVDASDGVGGLWRHGVYQGVHIVSSKKSTGYTHYPMPAHYPDFPSSTQVLRYLESFAHDRDLDSSIEVRRKVVRAAPLADESWKVTFEDGEERIYKGVVVCNGHHWDKRMPRYRGRFTGSFIHSSDYKEPKQLQGRRVLVIGGGNSGCDIACEAARVGASCDWSLRSGYWFLPKTAFGRPLTDLPIWGLPVSLQRLILRGLVGIFIGDYRRYGLQKPDHKLFERHPAFGTDVLNYLRQGRIKPRADIVRFSGTKVHFNDGSVGEYDLVVAATGFNNSLPFLPKNLVPVEDGVVQVYGGAFPDAVKNLYIIGWAQPRNGFGTIIAPAAKLYAEMIAMQDELELPIGYVLRCRGLKLPTTHLIDPGATRRTIRFAHRMLPLLKRRAHRIAETEVRPVFDPSRFEFDGNEGPVAVNQ